MIKKMCLPPVELCTFFKYYTTIIGSKFFSNSKLALNIITEQGKPLALVSATKLFRHSDITQVI